MFQRKHLWSSNLKVCTTYLYCGLRKNVSLWFGHPPALSALWPRTPMVQELKKVVSCHVLLKLKNLVLMRKHMERSVKCSRKSSNVILEGYKGQQNYENKMLVLYILVNWLSKILIRLSNFWAMHGFTNDLTNARCIHMYSKITHQNSPSSSKVRPSFCRSDAETFDHSGDLFRKL